MLPNLIFLKYFHCCLFSVHGILPGGELGATDKTRLRKRPTSADESKCLFFQITTLTANIILIYGLLCSVVVGTTSDHVRSVPIQIYNERNCPIISIVGCCRLLFRNIRIIKFPKWNKGVYCRRITPQTLGETRNTGVKGLQGLRFTEALLRSHAICTSHLIKLSEVLSSRVRSIMRYYVANSLSTVLLILSTRKHLSPATPALVKQGADSDGIILGGSSVYTGSVIVYLITCAA